VLWQNWLNFYVKRPMSRSKLGFVGAQTESEIIEFASDRRTSDKKVVTGWQSVSCRCPHGVEQSAVNSHCCVNCAFIPSSIHRILPIRCRYYLQRNMLLTTMLGDLAVFWLYVTLICSFLHYITLHYITLHYNTHPQLNCILCILTQIIISRHFSVRNWLYIEWK